MQALLSTVICFALLYPLRVFIRHNWPNASKEDINLQSIGLMLIVWWLLLNGLTDGVLVFIFCAGFYLAVKWTIFGLNEDLLQKIIAGLRIFTVILWLGLIFYAIPKWGEKIPNSRFERARYSRMLYVYLYPNEDSVKSYKVPAMVHAGYSECGEDKDGLPEDCRDYLIELAVMPNGGVIKFAEPGQKIYDDSSFRGQSIFTDKVSFLTDTNNRSWGVQLTAEPASE